MLEALSAYVAEHGHARPPQKYRSPEGQPVGKWKEKLRRRYSEGRLDQREIGELEQLPGWRWQEEPDGRWETGLEHLRAFAEESGHASVTRWYQSPDGYALGKWVSNQRQRRDRMPPDRKRAVESVPGWRWTAADARLDRVLAEVARYHAEHGAVPMPRNYRPGHDPELALGEWMTEQVSDYNSGRMDPDLAFRLEMIPGFVWGQRDAAFRDLHRRLAGYAAAHGAADPPVGYACDDGFPLGRRVGWLRREYWNGNLSAGRIAALERLRGWTWDSANPGRLGPDQESFDVALRRLREYAADNDISVIPPGIRIRDGRSLKTWTHNLRNAYRHRRLPADRIAALESVPGWSWTPRSDAEACRREQWMTCLRAYAAEHGTARVPYGYVTPDGASLGAWVYRQRVKKRDGTLSADHAAALESLPGWTWDSGHVRRRPRGLPKIAALSTRPESDGRRECPECGRRFWDLGQHVMLTHEEP